MLLLSPNPPLIPSECPFPQLEENRLKIHQHGGSHLIVRMKFSWYTVSKFTHQCEWLLTTVSVPGEVEIQDCEGTIMGEGRA